jgi:hypothetical protein
MLIWPGRAKMSTTRVTRIVNELMGLLKQQDDQLHSDVAINNWTQAQLDGYESRRERIDVLATELAITRLTI